MFAFLRCIVIVGAILTGFGGCTSSSDSNTGGSSMSATIGSDNWTATTVQATNSNGVVAIAGINTTTTTQIQLRTVGLSQPGTAQIGQGMPHTALLFESNTTYTASAVLGSGTITFTKLTSQEAEGTFSFTAVSDKQTSRTVTNGKFSVRFQ